MSRKPPESEFHPTVLSAITEAVSGGSADLVSSRFGRYRKGNELERLFKGVGLSFSIAGKSRVQAVAEALSEANKSSTGRQCILKLIEIAVEVSDYIDAPDKLNATVEYLNARLNLHDLTLERIGKRYSVVGKGSGFSDALLLKHLSELRFESVKSDLAIAEREIDSNPAGAIRSACNTLESVFKYILDDSGSPRPQDQSIKHLEKEVSRLLKLSPGRDDLPKEWENDLRAILSGLSGTVGGIGSLRTHASDAHGQSKRLAVDARLSRLAVRTASTLAMFYVETWIKLKERASKGRDEVNQP